MSNLASSGILINGKIWSTSNLDVSTFRNGDPIPEVNTDEEWVEAGKNEQPAWCWASNDPEGRKKYGKLYNHYAVADPRGLASEGWRIPSYDELAAFIVDRKLTSEIVNRQLTDEIDLPMAGRRTHFDGSLLGVGSFGGYWSSTVDRAFARFLVFGSNAKMDSYYRARGLSVRCLKD